MSEIDATRMFWNEFAQVLAPPADVADYRRGFDALMARFAVPADADITEVFFDGVKALLVGAAGATAASLVIWAHSGGYVFGSSTAYRAFATELSAATGGQVLLVDYRLAPEHPYPAAVDDMAAAYRWVLREGRSPGQVIIGGDSAGGGVAATTVLQLRACGLPPPAGTVLNSPITDQTWSGESVTARAEQDPVASKDALEMLSALYRGDVPAGDPRVSALFGDWTGTPPMLVHVGTAEILYDDSKRLVETVCAAGGEAELVTGEGMYHIYPALSPICPTGRLAIERIGGFVTARTGGLAEARPTAPFPTATTTTARKGINDS